MCSDGWFIGFLFHPILGSWVYWSRCKDLVRSLHKAQKIWVNIVSLRRWVAKTAWHTDFHKLTMELRHVENPCALW